VYADIQEGARGRQATVGLSTTAIFGDLVGYFFGQGQQYYMAIYYPLWACY